MLMCAYLTSSLVRYYPEGGHTPKLKLKCWELSIQKRKEEEE